MGKRTWIIGDADLKRLHSLLKNVELSQSNVEVTCALKKFTYTMQVKNFQSQVTSQGVIS